MGKVFYWDGIIGESELLEKYASVIEKLEGGNYREADLDLKKLPGYSVYSVRVNIHDRLLFTTISGHNNQRHLLLLEEIKNHDYQKSRFLKPGVLARFIENKGSTLIPHAIIEADFGPIIENVIPTISNNKQTEATIPVCMTYYNTQFLELNLNQKGAIDAPLPLIIEGGPGAGKTTTAVALIESKIKEYREIESLDKKILYITRSKNLTAEMSRQWQSHPGFDTNLSVNFETDETLYRKLNEQISDSKEIGKTDFESWFKIHKKDIRKRSKADHFIEDFVAKTNVDIVYQEFRIISAYTEEEYLNLGRRRSLFTEKKERQYLYSAYKAYQSALHEHHQFDPAFTVLDKKNQYDFIVVDEAQDLSLLQIKQLDQLAIDGQIVFCINHQQSIADMFSKTTFLHILHPNIQTIILPESYRCPKSVINFANQVLMLKFELTGGALGKDEVTYVHARHEKETEKKIKWGEPTEDSLLCLKNFAKKRSDCAVITHKDYKKEAQEKFDTPLVFTVEEIKGLEYETIIVYRLFNNEIFYEANKTLPEILPNYSKEKKVHRPKNEEGEAQYGPPFNQIYTALTRTINQLIIVQESSHKLSKVIEIVKDRLEFDEIEKNSLLPQKVSEEVESSIADWSKEAERLRSVGLENQAKAIDKKIQKTPQQVLIDQFSEKDLIDFFKTHKEIKEVYSLTIEQNGQTKSFIDTILLDPKKIFLLEKILIENKNLLAKFIDYSLSLHNIVEPNSTRAYEKSESRLCWLITFMNKCNLKNIKQLKNEFLMIAVFEGYLNAVNILITEGANTGFIEKTQRFTLLMLASQRNHYEIAKVLLEKNAHNINQKNENEETALHFATGNGNKKMAELLLKNGANVNIKGFKGTSSMGMAVVKGDQDLVELYIKYVDDINKKDSEGQTFLYYACLHGHVGILNILLENGASLKSDSTRPSPLVAAVSKKHIQIAEILIKHGADVNFSTPAGSSALHEACLNQDINMVKMLLDHQANPKGWGI